MRERGKILPGNITIKYMRAICNTASENDQMHIIQKL